MGSTAGRYFTRSPRYILRTADSNVLRFAAYDPNSPSVPATIIDLSQSGLAFAVAHQSIPQVGAVIKVEFSIPGQDQIAWFARVRRVEPFILAPEPQAAKESRQASSSKDGNSFHVYEPPRLEKVAIDFANLPRDFQRKLHRSLRSRVHINAENGSEIQLDSSRYDRSRQLLVFVLLTLAMAAITQLSLLSPGDFLR